MSSGFVYVVDDDEAVLDSLRFMLESAGLSVRTYAGADVLLAADLSDAGCVLTDFQMPGIDGLRLQAQLTSRGIRLPVIIMTAYGDIPAAVHAMKAGAVDFLQKPFTEFELRDAVARALDRNRLALDTAAVSMHAASKIETLTVRERQVLDLLVEGNSSKEIGKSLGISPRTIDVHRARVFHKLDAGTLPQLVHLVLKARLIASERAPGDTEP